jgi:hypothetical protein
MKDETPVPPNVGHQDDGESYDAGDEGETTVPGGTDAILFAQMLVDLRDAGFPEDPNDPDGSKLCEGEVHHATCSISIQVDAGPS